MEVGTLVDPVEFKVNELLKEVQVDYSPSLTKIVDDTVSAIKGAISKIPEDFQVLFHGLPVMAANLLCTVS